MDEDHGFTHLSLAEGAVAGEGAEAPDLLVV